MGRKLMKGCGAIAEAAIQCGCRAYFGYPITPQSEISEYMSARMPEAGGVFVQAESEVAASAMLFGGACTGVRTMTSSSGPGISLMQEGLSYIAATQVPCVIINIQRGGPGLGNLATTQTDYFQSTRGGGHGDYNVFTLAPSSVQEACDLTQLAFDIADRYRTPVIVLGDATIAQSMEPVTIRTVEPVPTDKSWAATGWSDKSRPCAKLTSIQRNEADLGVMIDRLQACYRQIKANHEERFATYRLEDAEYVIAAFGTVGRIALSAVDLLREQGIRAGLFRPVTLWPFPEQQLYELASNGTTKEILVAEMNAGQMVYDVELAVRRAVPVSLYNDRCTFLPLPSAIAARVRQLAESHQ